MSDLTERIEVLPVTEGIRRRPSRHVDNTTSDGLHVLALELIARAVKPDYQNECTHLTITIHRDESLSIKDNGRGQPIKPHGNLNYKPLIEGVMTTIFAGGWLEDIYWRFGYLFNFGVLINALSEWLELETIAEGFQYRMVCHQGNITQPLYLIGSSAGRGTYLRFKPDATIWTETKFEADILITGIKQFSSNVTILLQDERNETTLEVPILAHKPHVR